jgi:Carboxypeptidase regulatory-like domain
MLFPKAVKMILNGSGKLVLIVALVFPLAVAMSGAVALAKETGTITGLVFDPQGATGPRIEVELRWNDASGEMCWTRPNCPKAKKPRIKSVHVTTGADGKFSAKVAAGNWDVFVYHDGLVPTCTTVSVEAEKTTNIELRLPRYVATSLQ